MNTKRIVLGSIFHGVVTSLLFIGFNLATGDPSGLFLYGLIALMFGSGFLIHASMWSLISRRFKARLELQDETLKLNDMAVYKSNQGEVIGKLFLTTRRLAFLSESGPREPIAQLDLHSIKSCYSPGFLKRRMEVTSLDGTKMEFKLDFASDWIKRIEKLRSSKTEYELDQRS